MTQSPPPAGSAPAESAPAESASASPAQQLTDLLDTLPEADRKRLTAWLLGRLGGTGRSLSAWQLSLREQARLTGAPGRLTGTLPAGEDSQLVTIRLPAERHAALRDWCATHEFSMAAVIRGLVERFLEQQQRSSEI